MSLNNKRKLDIENTENKRRKIDIEENLNTENLSTENQKSGTKRKRESTTVVITQTPPTKKLKTMSKTNNLRKTPVKKIVLKPFSVPPKLPDNYEEDTWKKLQKAIVSVHNKESSGYGQEELYNSTNNLCINKWGPTLYLRIKQECEAHLAVELGKLISFGFSPNSDEGHLAFLQLFNNIWQDHCQDMLYIVNIFLPLDRTYVLQTPNVKSLWEMGLELFRTKIVLHSEIGSKVVTGILLLIKKDRNGESINKILLTSLIRMFISLQIYDEKFEKIFFQETKTYYSLESKNLLESLEIPDYMNRIENRIDEEKLRGIGYLPSKTLPHLISALETELILNPVENLLSRGFNKILDANRKEDLLRMYNLLKRVSQLDLMNNSWKEYIKAVGTAIITDHERDDEMITRILTFKSQITDILESCFSKNETYFYSLKSSFEIFINVRENKPAELLAKYLDVKLKSGGSKGISEDQLENLMDQLIDIFRYINGKDVFEAFYKKDLAKRLLLNSSVSIDAEKSMISKLKTECGSGFTSKLEGMFKDVDLSKELSDGFKRNIVYVDNKNFNNKIESDDNKNIISRISKDNKLEMTVWVLTTGYWPAFGSFDIKLPIQLMEYQEAFKHFYLGKHNGRKLSWMNMLGHATLKVSITSKRHEFVVSLVQTVVLMVFNDADPSVSEGKVSYDEIKEATGVDEKELKRALLSLACGKVRVLIKSSKGREINSSDTFALNKNFTHKLYRIKINSIQAVETPEENSKTKEGIFQDRQYQIDAAIVRIMKTRKTLAHPLLMSELYKQLKFPLKPADVKKRIESLIDREYIEREKDNPNVYLYLA